MFDNLGIGIDIVNVEQFREKNYSENIKFYQKIFSRNEIEYCLKFTDPYPHFAGKFALKEAVLKSISENIMLIDIETNHSLSKPTVHLKNHTYKFLALISNEKEIAVAVILSFKI
jgi:holo-[acyl-carrier protein] synthase